MLHTTVSSGARALCLVLALGVGAGCDHLTDDIDGPRLIDRFGEFTLVETLAASRSTADFGGGEAVTFTARFNKQVAWVIEITGQESGAVKRIEGFSNELGAENAVWRGGTTSLPLFKDEPVEAVLLITEEEVEIAPVQLTVATPRTYPGAVFADFEGGENIFVGNFEFEFQNAGISSEVPAGEGDAFYLLRGTEPPSGSTRNFFVGLIDIRPDGNGLFTAPTTVPENLYFNFFLRGFDTDNTIAVIQLIVDGNGTGAYEIDRDRVFAFGDVNVDFEGWRLFSKPVSELTLTSDASVVGLTQEEAANIVAVRVVLISADNNQPATPLQVAFGIDNITFTANGPFQP